MNQEEYKNWAEKLYSLKSEDLMEYAIRIFKYQAKANPVYKEYLSLLNINIPSVDTIEKIPFLPVEFFKTHTIVSGENKPEITFLSSSTTGQNQSRHPILDLSLYNASLAKGFESAYGSVRSYCILALLPSYLERSDSSLVYMTEQLVKASGHSLSGFFLEDLQRLSDILRQLADNNHPTILLGVTFALLDLAEQYPQDLRNMIIMETGGMKGRRQELIREDLHKRLKHAFGVQSIHSEYGMTELLSQAYSKGNGLFTPPPWMKVLVRDAYDPFSLMPDEQSGCLNIIDLANIHSCSFIATDDLGIVHPDGSFEVLGRLDHADIRGCNLLVE